MGNLYTIGHSTVPFKDFLQLLQKYEVNFLLDVRSTPYSKYAAQFNRELLQKELEINNIHYCYMGTYFGARQNNPALYTPEGYLDFEKVRQQESFQIRLQSVIRGLKEGNRIALMCTEKDPFDCHRAIMVGRGFELAGVEVNHILHDGNLQSQAVLNERLLDFYCRDRYEFDLFATEHKTDAEYLIEAYRKRNQAIGYHWGSLKEEVG